ncbi:MIR motif-containing protein [Cunninghamella echinulata]|nr:MIR motif-containing protein [Cunninghamella echinulata]
MSDTEEYRGKNPGEGEKICYGDYVELKHIETDKYINTDGQSYEGGSGQLRVFASDSAATWRILPIGESEEQFGYEVGYDDPVTLQLVDSSEKLHSSPGFPSPITGQQEVSTYSGNDSNDNWIIKPADDENEDGFWRGGERVFLIHANSDSYLHSHPLQLDDDNLEVTTYNEGDENSVWVV